MNLSREQFKQDSLADMIACFTFLDSDVISCMYFIVLVESCLASLFSIGVDLELIKVIRNMRIVFRNYRLDGSTGCFGGHILLVVSINSHPCPPKTNTHSHPLLEFLTAKISCSDIVVCPDSAYYCPGGQKYTDQKRVVM